MKSPSDTNWEVAPQDSRTLSLSVHLRRRSFVFPWHTFLFAEGSDDSVSATFHSHSVSINGSGLSGLLSDLAAQRVISLTEPDRTAKFQQQVGPLITAISIVRAV